jgi:membrane protein
MPGQRFSRLVKILTGAISDAGDEIFQLEGRLERFVHFWALVCRQFIRHRCLVRASALSYSTLLALIPLLVIVLSVASTYLKNTDVEKLNEFVEQAVSSLAPPAEIPTNTNTVAQTVSAGEGTNAVVLTNSVAELSTATNDVALAGANATNAVARSKSAAEPAHGMTLNTRKEVAQKIHELVQKTSSGALGITGTIVLIFTAISLLRGIEENFNDIWGVTRGRNWFLQIMLYWTTLTLGPLLLVTALGATGSVHFQHTRSFLEASPFLAPVLKHVVPIVIISFMLALFYKFTPNTKVEFNAALVGGFCAGVAWHFYTQLSFLLAQRAFSANAFYGNLFLIVLVMGGLYIVWLILLFGVQIAYAYQNRVAYLQDRLADNINQRGREFVALRLMTCLGQRFQQGLRPATVLQLSTELGVPSRLTQSVLRTLTQKELVLESAGAEAGFAPARPLDGINAYDILVAMRTGAGQELPLLEAAGLAEVYGEFARIEQAECAAASAITLRMLVNRLPQNAALPAAKAETAPAALPAVLPVPSVPPANAEVKIIEMTAPPAPPPQSLPAELPAFAEPQVEAPDKPRRPVAGPSETDIPL